MSGPAFICSTITTAQRGAGPSLFFQREFLGRRLVFGFPPHGNVSREIVGAVADIHDVSLQEEPGPMMYVPFAQGPFWGAEIVVKSSLDSRQAFLQFLRQPAFCAACSSL